MKQTLIIKALASNASQVLALLCATICRLGWTAWLRITLSRHGEVHDLFVFCHPLAAVSGLQFPYCS